MGYRSEVALGIREVDYKKLEEKVNSISDEKLKASVTELLRKDAESSLDEDGNYHILKWSDIKWYEDFYPEINWLMNNLPPIYAFIRIGEDTEDIEQKYSTEDPDTGELDDYMYEILGITRDIYTAF